MEPLGEAIVRQLAKRIPIPLNDQKALAVARGIQVIGILICVQAGIPMNSAKLHRPLNRRKPRTGQGNPSSRHERLDPATRSHPQRLGHQPRSEHRRTPGLRRLANTFTCRNSRGRGAQPCAHRSLADDRHRGTFMLVRGQRGGTEGQIDFRQVPTRGLAGGTHACAHRGHRLPRQLSAQHPAGPCYRARNGHVTTWIEGLKAGRPPTLVAVAALDRALIRRSLR